VRTQGKGKRPPALIGVEHFRVDHFSALQKGRKNKEGNQGSLVVPMQREVDKVVERLDLADGLTHLPGQMLNCLWQDFFRHVGMSDVDTLAASPADHAA